jgi:regulator of cell morphogenesis and NO signaling
MKTFSAEQTVGEIVAQNPNLSRVFESLGVDYCCGGEKTLEDACRLKRLSSPKVLAMLEAAANAPAAREEIDLETMTLTALADHIVRIHHDFLRRELPRLAVLTDKIAAVHGSRDRRLIAVRNVFAAMASEMNRHMWKEEQVLFPLIRRLEAGDMPTEFHCASLAYPIRQMESEHDEAGSALDRLQALTDSFTPPEWACNSYRVMLDALNCLQQDMHVHIHKENAVLFPRALALEAQSEHRPLLC